MKNLDQKFKSSLKDKYIGVLIFLERECLTPKNATSKLHDPKKFYFQKFS